MAARILIGDWFDRGVRSWPPDHDRVSEQITDSLAVVSEGHDECHRE